MFDAQLLRDFLDDGRHVPIPKMAKVRQIFDSHRLADVEAVVRAELCRPEIAPRIEANSSIGIGVGSRGIAGLEEVVRTVVRAVKARGAQPFIFPAMGSHGGATAAGQTAVLSSYGITATGVGAPVRATMETVIVDHMQDGTPLHMDRIAHEADGVVLINRIKPHTNFRGDIMSGLAKMMVIGMGKMAGAAVMHKDHGMDRFGSVVPAAAELLMQHIPFLFGVALVEDAYDQLAHVEALLPDRLLARETELLGRAGEWMGRLYFEDIDVLVIDRMGKEISGSGFDPNITGRNCRGVEGFDRPRVQKIVLLDLSDRTHGNAAGVGMADVITRRLFEHIDFAATYANVITSAYLDGAAIPIVMETPLDAIRLAIKSALRVKPEDARLVRIPDTLSLAEIHVSESMLAEVRRHPRMEQLTEPREVVPADFCFPPSE